MKRLATNCVIAAYIGALCFGIVAHAIKYKVNSHPGMYYIVWDMFCGWAAYSSRTQIIAEGESGRYYQVAPPPWGELKPFGHIERRHYDPYEDLMGKLIRNNLRNTSHEPITNVYVVEEIWPKKFNLPDDVWAERFNGQPKDVRHYYNVRGVYNGAGVKLQCRPTWNDLQIARSVADNPRLRKQAQGAQPFFTHTYEGPGSTQRSMAPSAN